MLLILIAFVILVRYFVPGKNIPVEYVRIAQNEIITDTVAVKAYRENKVPLTGTHFQRDKKSNIVDLNRCDTSELIRLPGIGPVLSVRIIKYRNLLGGYAVREQLREVYGLRPETYETIKDRVTVDSSCIERIEINSADYKRLSRMPYFEKGQVNSILKFRELEGRIKSIDELVENKLIGEETAKKLKPYLKF